jgi:hypothetical protein
VPLAAPPALGLQLRFGLYPSRHNFFLKFVLLNYNQRCFGLQEEGPNPAAGEPFPTYFWVHFGPGTAAGKTRTTFSSWLGGLGQGRGNYALIFSKNALRQRFPRTNGGK